MDNAGGLVVVLVVAVLVVVLGASLYNGLPVAMSKVRPYDYPYTKIPALGCMGFIKPAGQTGLHNQGIIDANGVFQQGKWPADQLEVLDKDGKTVKVRQVPVVGRPAGTYSYKQNKKGTWVKDKLLEAKEGTPQDCCELLQQAGSLSAAAFDHESKKCYVFPALEVDPAHDGKSPQLAANYINTFPLHDEQHQRVENMQLSGKQLAYMVACGGQGNLPCDYNSAVGESKGQKGGLRGPVSTGCSNRGFPKPGTPVGAPGTVTMYHSEMASPLPFSDDRNKPYFVCETWPIISNMGRDPNTGKWASGQLPVFNEAAEDGRPFDYNKSHSMFST